MGFDLFVVFVFMPDFDLGAYFARIGFTGTAHPDLETLRAIHRGHVEAIPFENLEIQLGGAIRLEPDALQAKMVHRRRGGYCFEQNALFSLALEAVGFIPLTGEARVRQNAGGVMFPRTHMVLTVPCEGRDWLVDVGFGGDGLLEPLPFDGEALEQAGMRFRIAREGSLRVLQRESGASWEDLYAVLPDPAYPPDFIVANWFTSTFPRSPFVLNVTAQRVANGARHILRNLTYTVMRGDQTETREIRRDELVPLLRETFGLDVPEDARFRALDS